jgi:hypothetical protein
MVGNRCVGSVISGLFLPQALKKVRRPWSFRQRKERASGKGECGELAQRDGNNDSSDAAQRVPTSPFKVLPQPPVDPKPSSCRVAEFPSLEAATRQLDHVEDSRPGCPRETAPPACPSGQRLPLGGKLQAGRLSPGSGRRANLHWQAEGMSGDRRRYSSHSVMKRIAAGP